MLFVAISAQSLVAAISCVVLLRSVLGKLVGGIERDVGHGVVLRRIEGLEDRHPIGLRRDFRIRIPLAMQGRIIDATCRGFVESGAVVSRAVKRGIAAEYQSCIWVVVWCQTRHLA